MFIFSAVAYSQKYMSDLSKFDKKRPYRSKTLYIVLHTTEAGDESSLASVKRGGTCNYLVTTDGIVHIIISPGKMAKHAGRSMWNGNSNLSESTIGIEISGWHNKKPTKKQEAALKKLIAMLKKKYKLDDTKVVTHSMVAYGNPNKWFSFKHRGRKRCGMLFATSSIRKQLGLKNTFKIDPDCKARRLKVADVYLSKILFGVFTSKEEPSKIIKQTDGDDAIEEFQEITSKESIQDIAGNEYKLATTIYFFESGTIRTGKELVKEKFTFKDFPKGTKVLVGYIYCGKISANRSAYKAVGKKNWNLPSTFYILPDGNIKTGDDIDDGSLPEGTIVVRRK